MNLVNSCLYLRSVIDHSWNNEVGMKHALDTVKVRIDEFTGNSKQEIMKRVESLLFN